VASGNDSAPPERPEANAEATGTATAVGEAVAVVVAAAEHACAGLLAARGLQEAGLRVEAAPSGSRGEQRPLTAGVLASPDLERIVVLCCDLLSRSR